MFAVHRVTLNAEEIPLFVRDKFLRKGYLDLEYVLRPNAPSLSSLHAVTSLSWARSVLLALFTLHNETLNIWTHLLPAVIFLALAVVFLVHPGALGFVAARGSLGPSALERLVISLFFVGVVTQMGLSTLYHIAGPISALTARRLQRLDHAGVACMIACSYYVPIFFGFACQPRPRVVYSVIVSCFVVASLLLGSLPAFTAPSAKPLRAAFFLCFGWFALVCGPHLLITEFEYAFPLMMKTLLMGLIYVGGVAFYVSRFPERSHLNQEFRCHSHVIWHFFTILAAVLDLHIVVSTFNRRQLYPCQPALSL